MPRLAERLAAARATKAALDRGEESALLIAIAPHLEDFVALLFGVEAEVAALQQAQHELAPLYACKRQVVQRKAMNKYKADEAACFDGDALRAELELRLGAPLDGLPGELAFARAVGAWSADEARARRGHRARASLCRVGGAHAGRQGATPDRRAVQGAAQARLPSPDSGRARAQARRR